MAFFNYKKTVQWSYLDRRNPPYINRGSQVVGQCGPSGSGGSPMGGGNPDHYEGSRWNQVRDKLEDGSVLEEWVPRNPVMLHKLFRNIYLRDAIAGTVVDIFSNLPWGKYYELIGIDDAKVLQMFNDMMEAINIWGELPLICRNLLIIGRNIGSLSFNDRRGLWDSLVPIDADQAMLTPIPVSGHKPLVDVLSSPAWRKFADSTDPRVVEIKERLNPSSIEILKHKSGYLPLDPMNTLWLARRVNQDDHIGTSLFTRILPAWAYETALWNASLTGVRRRNRTILLLTAGIDESWEPTEDELNSLVGMFTQAEEDPTGGVVAVRNGVEVSEVRDPTAIWGISQEYDFLSTVKMRALGVSEAYLSGETNVSNMEAARTSLGKNIAAFRDFIINQLFTKQLFPAFARIHNMQKRTQAELNHNIRTNGWMRAYGYEKPTQYISAKQAMDIPNDALLVPQLITEDTLRPEQDPEYLEMLGVLEEKGVPVPLRIWAAAAGYDLDKALAMMEDDQQLKRRLSQLDLSGEGGGGGEGGAAPAEEGSSSGGQNAEDLFNESATVTPEGGSEQAGHDQPSPTLPPRWSVGSRTYDIKKVDQVLESFKGSKLIKALSSLDPRVLAEMDVPPSRAIIPYKD